MDTRSLIALGMLLTLVFAALMKGAVQAQEVKEIVLFLGGGIVGFTVPRSMHEVPPKPGAPKPPAGSGTAMAMLLVGAMILLAGCSYTIAYTGPPGPPTLDGVEWLWPDINGKLRRETTQLVTNRNFEPTDVILDCSPHGHGHMGRNWQGSRLTLHLPPRTTVPVLLHPHDHLCQLLPVEADGIQ